MGRSLKLLLPVLLCVAGLAAAAEKEGDAGESREAMQLKHRARAPAAGDIDGSVTLDGLLAKSAETDWTQSHAAKLQGYVVMVEREEDGDLHLVLAGSKQEPDTRKWVIVEVTPAWARKNHRLAAAALHRLIGKQIEVTGWLYYEPDTDQPDPRGTRWELHPVTDITPSP
jgi:hypothetical protein